MYRDYRRVQGYPDYIISNYGEVYSTFKYGTCWRELKPNIDKYGYKKVVLCNNGIRKDATIHALVGNAFVGLREGELTFDHEDQNKLNNRADNIRLATKSEQTINQKINKSNTSGEKYISTHFKPGYEYYHIQIKRNGKHVFRKSLNKKKYTIEDAKKLRDDFLLTY